MSDVTIPPAQVPVRSKRRSWAHPRAIIALMLREMSAQYGRNPGGYIWAVLEPLGMILFLSIGFALMLRAPSLGNSFLLFYATGFLPYNLFLKTTRMVMFSLNYSRNLLKYPAVTWFDAVVARAVLYVLTEMLVSYLILAGILIVVESRTTLEFGPILTSFAMAATLGFGIGLVNCVVMGFFPIWRNIWLIFTRPLFLASGVFWIMSDLPPVAADVLWYNPLVHITAVARMGYYSTYDPQFVSYVFVMSLALGLTAIGLLLMRRFHLVILGLR